MSDPAAKLKRILFIEDEQGFQDFMETVLGPVFDLTICSNAEEAVAKMESGYYDLVISDINLHGMSGFEVLGRLGEEGVLETCPFVLCSSQFDPETKQKAMDMGAAGFITKPYKAQAVLATVYALLGLTAPKS